MVKKKTTKKKNPIKRKLIKRKSQKVSGNLKFVMGIVIGLVVFTLLLNYYGPKTNVDDDFFDKLANLLSKFRGSDVSPGDGFEPDLTTGENFCIDSDGGLDFYKPGHISTEQTDYYDECTDIRSLSEYWCDGDNAMVSTFLCPTGSECLQTSSGGYCFIAGEPEGYEVGDIVGGGNSGSGDANFGDDVTTPITLDWTTGGPYILGAKITRSWNYIDSPDCEFSGPQQYPMEWTLYDSNGMAWQKYDYIEVNNVVDYVCPVTYHEDAPWKFIVSVGIQDCGVSYSWNVQPYICEVLD